MQQKHHWGKVYSTKPTDGVSWYQEYADQSLGLICRLKIPVPRQSRGEGSLSPVRRFPSSAHMGGAASGAGVWHRSATPALELDMGNCVCGMADKSEKLFRTRQWKETRKQ